jgi:hypothetical protein
MYNHLFLQLRYYSIGGAIVSMLTLCVVDLGSLTLSVVDLGSLTLCVVDLGSSSGRVNPKIIKLVFVDFH